MRKYEQDLQKALLKVIDEHRPITKFEFGIQLGYIHAISRATVTGRCEEIDEKLFELTQQYHDVIRSET